jgi:hypothetical protein
VITIAYSFTDPPTSQGGKIAKGYYLSGDGTGIYFGYKRWPGQGDVELGERFDEHIVKYL